MVRLLRAVTASLAALFALASTAIAQSACPAGEALDSALQQAVTDFQSAGGQKRNNKTSSATAMLQAYAILLWEERSKSAIDDQQDAKWALAVCLEKDGVCGGNKHKDLSRDLFRAVGKGYTSGYMNTQVYPESMVAWAERRLGCTTGPVATLLEQAYQGTLPPLAGLTGEARYEEAIRQSKAEEQPDFYPQLVQACFERSTEACDFLASVYEGNEDEESKKLAIRFSEKSCELNSPFGCRFSAIYYSQGRPGVPRDDNLGELRAIKACDLGDTLSCGVAALHFSTPETETYSQEKSRHYRGLDCDRQGNPLSCRIFGYMAINGQGGPEDKVAARAALETACAGDEDLACLWVGSMKTGGSGGPVDLEGGRAATQKACDLGNSAACDALQE